MSDPRIQAAPTPLRKRIRMRWLAAGLLAVCLGGLGAAMLYSSLTNAHSVVRVNQTVYRGEVITAADLAVVSVGDLPGVATLPAERVGDLVGQTALTDLPQGSLLSPASVGTAPVQPGTAQLGLKLAPGRVPAAAMPVGTPVLLVPAGTEGPPGPSVRAVVAGTSVALPDGTIVLDVGIPSSQVERIARLAAAEQLVVVRQAAQR